VVYLANNSEVRTQQIEQRQRQLQEEAARSETKLPSGCSAADVIEVLRAMIFASDDDPNRLARRLQGAGLTSQPARRAACLNTMEWKKNAVPEGCRVDAAHPAGRG